MNDLYAVQESLAGRIKIGQSGNVGARLAQLQTASPAELTLVLRVPGCGWLERTLHRAFRYEHIDNEWFKCSGPVPAFLRSVHEYADEFCPQAPEVLMALGVALATAEGVDGPSDIQASIHAMRTVARKQNEAANILERLLPDVTADAFGTGMTVYDLLAAASPA